MKAKGTLLPNEINSKEVVGRTRLFDSYKKVLREYTTHASESSAITYQLRQRPQPEQRPALPTQTQHKGKLEYNSKKNTSVDEQPR